jgi:hypothetical protein
MQQSPASVPMSSFDFMTFLLGWSLAVFRF